MSAMLKRRRALLEQNTAGFESIADPQQIADLKENLRKYRGLIDSYASGKSGVLKEKAVEEPIQKMNHENELRKVGKDIITVAEGISKTERELYPVPPQ